MTTTTTTTHGTSVYSSSRLKTKTNNRLEDDGDELQYLQNQLSKMDGLSTKLVGILDSFDDRLLKLEASILPIHRSTQNLTRLVNSKYYLTVFSFLSS
ncbi:uncharacterized protein BX664DRAFT_85676 [Halteromyces radiatus]|uniref:uncharacterized protein n=1 Tax=Halteromyces radiatus TaxID=101107 RepID=UPI00221E8CAB|nr:uncharacterized protein BX664DRAFT_85676 [Halteromyces radiatus]KAI8097725.1 hypothetical protein BX664DRAFT_85676 [Halteromyces radiatus]